MKDNLILQDKNYISAKRASVVYGYASDYVGQLCRSGKLECKMIGRSWFVTEESLIKHKEAVALDLLNKKTSHEVVKSPIVFSTSIIVTDLPTLQIFPKSLSFVSILVSPAPVSVQAPVEIKVFVEELQPITFAPKSFSIPVIKNIPDISYSQSSTVLSFSNFIFKFSIASIVAVIALVFFMQSIIISGSSTNTDSVATIISSSQEFATELVSIFTSVPKFAMNLFGKYLNNTNEMVGEVEKPPPEKNLNGLVVVPSTNSASSDELLKQRIRNTFSDEVQVSPDNSGTAGLITPVFRKAKSDDFVYVMVPISGQVKN